MRGRKRRKKQKVSLKKGHKTLLVKVKPFFWKSLVVDRKSENVDEVVRESEKVGIRWPRGY